MLRNDDAGQKIFVYYFPTSTMGQPANNVLVIRITDNAVQLGWKIGTALVPAVSSPIVFYRHVHAGKISVGVVDEGFLHLLGLLPMDRGGSGGVGLELRRGAVFHGVRWQRGLVAVVLGRRRDPRRRIDYRPWRVCLQRSIVRGGDKDEVIGLRRGCAGTVHRRRWSRSIVGGYERGRSLGLRRRFDLNWRGRRFAATALRTRGRSFRIVLERLKRKSRLNPQWRRRLAVGAVFRR